jgi:hypothetical protein
MFLADSLVRKARDFIDAVRPSSWFIENPYTGHLKHREVVWDLFPPVCLDYCKYGTRYRKRTAVWTNSDLAGVLCSPASRCEHFGLGGHPTSAQRGGKRGVRGDNHRVVELHRIPLALCYAVEAAARRAYEAARSADE